MNSFAVEPGDNIDVNFSGPNGTSLWLLQNNIPLGQVGLTFNAGPKK